MKDGRQTPLQKPRIYYRESYTTWAKGTIQALYTFKEKMKLEHPEINFPLAGSYFVSFWFWLDHPYSIDGMTKSIVDLSNLEETVQDLLTGNVGSEVAKTAKPEWYQILSDDNCRVITSKPTSMVLYDPVNPRTDIYIRTFDLKLFGEIHRRIYENTD